MENGLYARVVAQGVSDWRWVGMRVEERSRSVFRLMNAGVAFAPAFHGGGEAARGAPYLELAVELDGVPRVVARRALTREVVAAIRAGLPRETLAVAGGPSPVRSCWPHFARE